MRHLKSKIMERYCNERIPEHIQTHMIECLMRDISGHDGLAIFEAWEAKGCPSVEKVNKMLW